MLDSELWSRAHDHDGAAFGELFARHSTAVYNHCFRRTGSWSTAQDLTSVVFMDAWRRKKDVKLHDDSIRPWLLAVANNAIKNSNRSIRRHQRLLAKLPRVHSEPGFEDEADQLAADEQAMKVILEKLNSLRIEEREIVALIDWAGLSYAEAATAVGVPLGTVRSRLFRAHSHLRQLIENDPMSDRKLLLGAFPGSSKEDDESH